MKHLDQKDGESILEYWIRQTKQVTRGTKTSHDNRNPS